MVDVVVHGPVSWNLVVDLDELPDLEPHTVLGTDDAARSVEAALHRAGLPFVATCVEGPTERHLNLMDRAGVASRSTWTCRTARTPAPPLRP